MKIKNLHLISLPFLILCFTLFSNAQKISPYTDGEVLKYEGKLSKLVMRGLSIADLTFSTSKTPDGKNFIVKATATSKGTFLKMFRFNFQQNIESTIDGTAFDVLKTVKHDVQRERVRDSEAVFNYSEKKVTYAETDPKDSQRPPRIIASDISNPSYDLVSAVFIVRNMPLAVGKSFSLTVSDSGLVYEIPVKVTAREIQNTIFGKINCFRVEPQVFGDGRMIGKKGEMVIWFTDDNRRLPVRSQVTTDYGKIDVKLQVATFKK